MSKNDDKKTGLGDLAAQLAAMNYEQPCRNKCGATVIGPVKCVECHRAEEAEEARVKRAALDRTRQRAVKGVMAMIPELYQWARVDSADLDRRVRIKQAIAAVRTLATHPAADSFHDDPRLITFAGPAGVGKTSLAFALFRALVERESQRVVTHSEFVHSMDYVRDLGCVADVYELGRARQNHKLGEEAPIVAHALRARVLLLDEIGAEDTRDRTIAEVLHRRHAASLYTITTTGFSFDDLAQKYGAGIVRRLREQYLVMMNDLAGRERKSAA